MQNDASILLDFIYRRGFLYCPHKLVQFTTEKIILMQRVSWNILLLFALKFTQFLSILLILTDNYIFCIIIVVLYKSTADTTFEFVAFVCEKRYSIVRYDN